jgi:hypothetical protein
MLVPRDRRPAGRQSLVRARARTTSADRRKETTAAALRPTRGVPQAGFASGSFPAHPPSSRYGVVRCQDPARPGPPRPDATSPDKPQLARASAGSSDKDRVRIGRTVCPRRISLIGRLCRSAHPSRGAPERAAPAHPIHVSARAPLRRAFHFGSRSTPSRAASLSWL